MGKRRSYDYDRGYPTTVDRETSAATEDLPGRVVLWRDEWPPQSEVPHAGEVVYTTTGSPRVVWSGIPYRQAPDEDWIVIVHDDRDHSYSSIPLHRLSRTPPTKRYKLIVALPEGSQESAEHGWDYRLGQYFTRDIEAESEADAIAKAVRVEEVE